MSNRQFLLIILFALFITNIIKVWAQEFVIKPDGQQRQYTDILKLKKINTENLNNNNEYVLSWRKSEIVWWRTFLPVTNDSVAMWFNPLAACSLKSVRIYPIEFEGTLILDIWGSNYDGHCVIKDSTGFIGRLDTGMWSPGDILKKSPLKNHIWGPLDFSLSASESNKWIEIYPDDSNMVYIEDNNFLISLFCLQRNEYDGWFAFEDKNTIPFHYFYYSTGEHYGWHLFHRSFWLEAIVKYLEDTRPYISRFSNLKTQQVNKGPFQIEADIIDWNPIGGPAGVQEAHIYYLINDGDTLSVPMEKQENDTTFIGFIPELDSYNFQIRHWIKATDVCGNENNSYTWTFIGRGPVQAPILVVYDGYAKEGNLEKFDDLYLRALRGEYLPSRTYQYELWDKDKWKVSPSFEVLENVKTLLWYIDDSYSYASLFFAMKSDSSDIANFINRGGNFMVQEQEQTYLRYLYNNYLESDFDRSIPVDYFYRDYLGIIKPFFGIGEKEIMTGILGNEITGDPIFINMRLDKLTPLEYFGHTYPLEIDTNAVSIFKNKSGSTVGISVLNPQGSPGKSVYVSTNLIFCTPTQPGHKWPEQQDQFLLNVLDWFNTPVNVKDPGKEKSQPKEFILNQNYPNPFNSNTIINYQLPENCSVSLEIYNIKGQKVKTLIKEEIQYAGIYRAFWDGRNDAGNQMSSGVFIIKLVAGKFINSKKIVLMR